MTTPADRFVEAMRMLTKGAMPMELLYLRTLAVAFVDAICKESNDWQHSEVCGRTCRCETPEKHETCRTDFLKRCGLEE